MRIAIATMPSSIMKISNIFQSQILSASLMFQANPIKLNRGYRCG